MCYLEPRAWLKTAASSTRSPSPLPRPRTSWPFGQPRPFLSQPPPWGVLGQNALSTPEGLRRLPQLPSPPAPTLHSEQLPSAPQIGTYPIALVAQAHNKPVYVAAESYKFARLYPLSQADVPNRVSESANQSAAMQAVSTPTSPRHVPVSVGGKVGLSRLICRD